MEKKYKIHQKIVNQNGVFHKTPSSQFCLIRTFSGPNIFSLPLLITCLLTVIDLTEGNGQKSNLGAFCLKVFILAFFSFLSFFCHLNLFFLFSLCLYMLVQLSFIFFIFFFFTFINMLSCQIYVLLLCSIFLFRVSRLGFLNNPTHACHEHAYAVQILRTWDLACVCRPLFDYACICPKTLIRISALFGLLVSHILPLFKSFLHTYLYLSSYFTCFIFLFAFNLLDQGFLV